MSDLRDPKAALLRYLQDARDALLWKLEGLGERDLRLPRTPTGTNLLGIVRHVANVEIGYFGPYGCSSQWAAQSPITQGKAVNYAVTNTSAGMTEYINSDCYAYVNASSCITTRYLNLEITCQYVVVIVVVF